MQVFLYYLIVTDTECVNTGWVKIIGGFRYVRSLDLTVCDFFLWGFIKDNVYVPPLPKTPPELLERINTAIGNITQDMLGRVWWEWAYRLDMCRVTREAHIEFI